MRSNELLLMKMDMLNLFIIFDFMFDDDKMMKWEECCDMFSLFHRKLVNGVFRRIKEFIYCYLCKVVLLSVQMCLMKHGLKC